MKVYKMLLKHRLNQPQCDFLCYVGNTEYRFGIEYTRNAYCIVFVGLIYFYFIPEVQP